MIKGTGRMNAFCKFLKHKSVIIGLLLVIPVIISVLLTPYICRDPIKMDFTAQLTPPGEKYLLGTDELGRDLLSRTLYGARVSLYIGITVSILAGFFGLFIGAISAYYEKLDIILMRILDGWMAFPPLLLAILIAAAFGATVSNVILALTVVYVPRVARVARASTLEIKRTDYFEAARALGASNLRILLKHITPNALAPLIVQVTIIFAYSILAEAAISFVGAGVPPPVPSLGSILGDARPYFVRAPWLVSPGVFIVIIVLGTNLIGDGLRDTLDPKMRGILR